MEQKDVQQMIIWTTYKTKQRKSTTEKFFVFGLSQQLESNKHSPSAMMPHKFYSTRT